MNSNYLDMIRGKQPGTTSVWFMRQAGRSQEEYRKIKEKYSLFEITKQPELCAFVTELPVKEYGVDAAILYKDIMSPMVGMDVTVELKPGVGPVFPNPIRTQRDVEQLHPFDFACHCGRRFCFLREAVSGERDHYGPDLYGKNRRLQ